MLPHCASSSQCTDSECSRPQHCHTARAFIGPDTVPDGDGMSSELESMTREIRALEELELTVAEQMGMSGATIDEVAVLLEAKTLCIADLPRLGRLHLLRHQYNRTQERLPVEVEVSPSLPGSPYPVDGSRFFAVLIGINEYASYPLQGCVSDARLMEQYLTEDLGVPRNRIQLLIGSMEHKSSVDPMYPSRAHIIDMLLSIIDNPEVLYGDNIVIYYSGHGSCYPFEEIAYIEALCPIDRDTIGDNGQAVPDISDRELNTILKQISRAKGHHITVILDCCHSGGVTRGLPEPGSRKSPPARCATLQDMLLTGDRKFEGYPGYQPILSKDWHPDMSSHVVIAACKDYQFVKAKKVTGEDGVEGHIGIFTDSLVRGLRSGCLTRETTYVDLVRFLDRTPYQTPVVAGEHRNARIWYQE